MYIVYIISLSCFILCIVFNCFFDISLRGINEVDLMLSWLRQTLGFTSVTQWLHHVFVHTNTRQTTCTHDSIVCVFQTHTFSAVGTAPTYTPKESALIEVCSCFVLPWYLLLPPWRHTTCLFIFSGHSVFKNQAVLQRRRFYSSTRSTMDNLVKCSKGNEMIMVFLTHPFDFL